MFEPIHGSAPDIAGKGIANPISAIWSGAFMLRHIGEERAARTMEKAIFEVFQQGLLTADLGGNSSTREITDKLLNIL
jgi:tartrate dehydrogenase/decarboxylase/D-malate dehydrogenase